MEQEEGRRSSALQGGKKAGEIQPTHPLQEEEEKEAKHRLLSGRGVPPSALEISTVHGASEQLHDLSRRGVLELQQKLHVPSSDLGANDLTSSPVEWCQFRIALDLA